MVTKVDHAIAEKLAIRTVACPHCAELIVLNCDVKMSLAQSVEDATTRASDDLSESQIDLIQKAKDSGILAAFINTHAAGPMGAFSSPAKGERAFLNFLLKSVRREFTPEVEQALRGAYDIAGRDVYALTVAPVTAVTVDGRILAFLPSEAAIGRSGKNLKAHERKAPDVGAVERWVKTRFGYVPAGAPVFATEMRKKSAGQFSTVSL